MSPRQRRVPERFPGFARRLTQAVMQSDYVRQTPAGALRADVRRLAQDVGVTTSVIYKWLHGRTFPGQHLTQLAERLHVRADDLTAVSPSPARGLIQIPALSTGFPEVDVIVAYLRGEFTTIWQQAGHRITEAQRRRIMIHLQNQVALIRELVEGQAPLATGL